MSGAAAAPAGIPATGSRQFWRRRGAGKAAATIEICAACPGVVAGPV